ncbi:hypothetical protein PWT90_08208 [Aphanocladium album]|nr:hypothetical protein PWT90_08208 [Aphanocladium album]
MPLKSHYDSGKFYNGKWYCGCEIEAPWFTSKQEHSRGEQCWSCPLIRCSQVGRTNSKLAVASCTRPRDQQCTFFLAAVDDTEARLARTTNVPPVPKTPVSTRTQAWLTPGTGSSSRDLFGSGAARNRSLNLSDSPTPHRYRSGGYGRGDDDADELASLVLGILRRDGVAIRSSTESAIRHTIGDRVAKYDAVLLNTEKSLSFTQMKLDELERGP